MDEEIKRRFWALVAERARRYTGEEDSSVPRELATAWLASICYTLGLAPNAPEEWLSKRSMISEEGLERGQKRLRFKKEMGRRLWIRVSREAPEASRTMEDTLGSIGGFWTAYDERYFAHEIPCMIDYPLSNPVSETLLGVDYVNEYLSRLHTENALLRRFPDSALSRLWRQYYGGLDDGGQNLYEPVVANVWGRALLGLDARGLNVPKEAYSALSQCPTEALRRRADEAVQRAGADLRLRPAEEAYMAGFVERLWPRFEVAARSGSMTGVFTEMGLESGDELCYNSDIGGAWDNGEKGFEREAEDGAAHGADR